MRPFFTARQTERLKRQWTCYERARLGGGASDLRPVVKLFTPDAAATWLIAAISPDMTTAWGVCDLGLGFVEIGEINLAELRALRGRLGLPIERDRWFTPDRSVQRYQADGQVTGRLAV